MSECYVCGDLARPYRSLCENCAEVYSEDEILMKQIMASILRSQHGKG